MEQAHYSEQSDIRRYLTILRRRRMAVLSIVIVGVVLSLAYSFVKPPSYEANSLVLVPELNALAQLNATQTQSQPDSLTLTRVLADEVQLAQGDQVRTLAERQLHYKPKYTVTASTTSDVLTFSVDDRSARQAATVANAYANAYIKVRDSASSAQYTQEITAIQATITQLSTAGPASAAAAPTTAATISSLTQSLHQLQAAGQLVSQTGPKIVKSATPPSSPISPKPLQNGLLGLIFGLVVGVAVAFLWDRLDDGINTRADAEEAGAGLPVLGALPLVDNWARNKAQVHLALDEEPHSAASEAYRTLRTAIEFLDLDRRRRIIGLTSSQPSEGKTTTVANLALSFARAERRVIVVSCDVRRPRLHSFFRQGNNVGLTNVLLGDVSLRNALQTVDGEPNLRFLTAGILPPNPTELFSLDRVESVMNTLADNSDIVLLDCPPVLPVADTLVLSRLMDGLLVLASARSTSKQSLSRTVQALRQVQAPLLGIVLNRVPNSDEGYMYSYGYGDEPYSAAHSSGDSSQLQFTRLGQEERESSVERPVAGVSRPDWEDQLGDTVNGRGREPGF